MFIHWGLYSVPAGVWNGKQVPGIGEWIMNHAAIPVADYEALVPQFNPIGFSAHDIVALAKSAGMKYIVVTAKHHEGFAMFDSKAIRLISLPQRLSSVILCMSWQTNAGSKASSSAFITLKTRTGLHPVVQPMETGIFPVCRKGTGTRHRMATLMLTCITRSFLN